MKVRILSLLLTLILIISSVPITVTADPVEAESGICGEDVTWSFNTDTGTLTLSGCGPMEDYLPNAEKPWSHLKDEVKTIVVEEGVTAIGKNAFHDFSALESLELPEGLTTIGYFTFDNCKNLKTITVPDSLKVVEEGAFSRCRFDSVYVSSLEVLFGIEFDEMGGFFFLEGTDLYVDGELTTDIIVPESVTKINPHTFAFFSNLKSITFHDGITEIGGHAFYGCTGLESISIPASVDVIGSAAFCACTGISEITIANGVRAIEDNAFNSCAITTVEIPDSVTTVGSFAFDNCPYLESAVLGDGITYLDRIFNECTALTSVKFGNNVESMYNGAFRSCTALTDITVPEENPYYQDVDGVLFSEDLTKLIQYPTGRPDSSYTVPSGVSTIGVYAFFNCIVETVILPDTLTELETGAFYGCANLTEIDLPAGLTVIPNSAFCGCDSLSTVIIPENVTEIDNYAFANCDSLEKVFLPDGITSIAQDSFFVCNNLKAVFYKGSQEQWEEKELCVYIIAPRKTADVIFEFAPSNTLGDVNGDGQITIYDILNLRKYIADVNSATNDVASDVSGDGKISLADVLLIRKYIAGLITEFPAR